MSRHWKVLLDAGVPWGAIRPKRRTVDLARLGRAVAAAAAEADDLEARQRDALAAWLRAFRGHWPMGFRRVLGTSGAGLLRKLERFPEDPNRYLKLKRIAVEALAELV